MAGQGRSFGSWQGSNQYPGGDAPFDVARTGGPQPLFRDPLDLKRSAWRATPEAQYPDGYLGTLNSRRSDRIMDSLANRAKQRPYTRGIHKGDRIDGRDYFWPDEFGPMTGLQLEAVGERFSPPGLGLEWTGEPLWDDNRVGLRGVPRAVTSTSAATVPVDPSVRERLASQAPPWSTGRPGMVTTPTAQRM